MLLFMLFIHVGKRLSRSSQIFFMTGLLKNFAIFTGKHLYWSLFLIKLEDWRLVFLLKETPTQVFFYEYCKIFKDSFFMEHLFIILSRNSMWWWILDVWRLYFTTVKLGHVAEITSWKIDQNFLERAVFFSTKISILLQRLFCYFIISILQRFVKELKLQRETSGSYWTILVSNLSKYI